jgi:hypothetical protein
MNFDDGANKYHQTAQRETVAFVFLGKLRPSADQDWDWVWDWMTLGPPKRHPRATQAWRKGGPRIDLRFGLCFQQKREKGRGGGRESSDRRPFHEIGKAKFHHGLTQMDAEQE